MNLSQPVTIQPPSFTRKGGEVFTPRPITFNELDVTLIDNRKRRYCAANVFPCPYPLVLWEGDSYDAAGDYTQSQAESRILAVLGSDLKAGLEKLFVPPSRPA